MLIWDKLPGNVKSDLRLSSSLSSTLTLTLSFIIASHARCDIVSYITAGNRDKIKTVKLMMARTFFWVMLGLFRQIASGQFVVSLLWSLYEGLSTANPNESKTARSHTIFHVAMHCIYFNKHPSWSEFVMWPCLFLYKAEPTITMCHVMF